MSRYKIGTVSVDAGMIWIGDPCYVMGSDSSHGPKTWADFCELVGSRYSEPLGQGVGFAVDTVHGDGEYPVYANVNERNEITSITVSLV